MADTPLHQALRRCAYQTISIWQTHQALIASLVSAYYAMEVREPLAALGTRIVQELEADKAFYLDVLAPQLATSQAHHPALAITELAELFTEALGILKSKGNFLQDLLSPHGLSQCPFPSDFSRLAGEQTYYASLECRAISTLLFAIWFSVTGWTAQDVSNQCAILQKIPLPSNINLPSDVENRWLVKGTGAAFVLAIPHNGFAPGGHRNFPRCNLTYFIGKFSPEDDSSFVFSVLPPTTRSELFDEHNPPTSAQLFEKLEPYGKPFPQPGDIVVVKLLDEPQTDEEREVFGSGGMHWGVLIRGNQFVTAARNRAEGWDGIAIQQLDRLATKFRCQNTFLRVRDGGGSSSSTSSSSSSTKDALAFAQCYEEYNQTYCINSVEFNHFRVVSREEGDFQPYVDENSVMYPTANWIPPAEQFPSWPPHGAPSAPFPPFLPPPPLPPPPPAPPALAAFSPLPPPPPALAAILQSHHSATSALPGRGGRAGVSTQQQIFWIPPGVPTPRDRQRWRSANQLYALVLDTQTKENELRQKRTNVENQLRRLTGDATKARRKRSGFVNKLSIADHDTRNREEECEKLRIRRDDLVRQEDEAQLKAEEHRQVMVSMMRELVESRQLTIGAAPPSSLLPPGMQQLPAGKTPQQLELKTSEAEKDRPPLAGEPPDPFKSVTFGKSGSTLAESCREIEDTAEISLEKLKITAEVAVQEAECS